MLFFIDFSDLFAFTARIERAPNGKYFSDICPIYDQVLFCEYEGSFSNESSTSKTLFQNPLESVNYTFARASFLNLQTRELNVFYVSLKFCDPQNIVFSRSFSCGSTTNGEGIYPKFECIWNIALTDTSSFTNQSRWYWRHETSS